MRLLLVLAMALATSADAFDLQGHRGARGHAPENTLPGFARAAEIGVTTLELDVGITRDGVVVVHHDRGLNPDTTRDAGGEWLHLPGPLLKDLTFEALQRYDVGRLRPGSDYARRFPQQKPVDGTRIPSLGSVLGNPRFASLRFNIETKIAADAPHDTLAPEAFARALIAEVRKAGAAARTIIQSFDWRTLAVVEREAPEMRTSYLTDERNAEPQLVHAAGARLWSPDFRTLTPRKLAEARRLGLQVIPWTVNEPADIARMLDAGVDGLISDYPDRVRSALKRRKK